jgi:hypothetical protein
MIAFYHQIFFYVSINMLHLLDKYLPNIKVVLICILTSYLHPYKNSLCQNNYGLFSVQSTLNYLPTYPPT